MPRDIEGRLRRLERRRAVQAFDPYEAHMIGIRCYEQGLELPADLTGEEREIAAAVLQTLTFTTANGTTCRCHWNRCAGKAQRGRG